MVPRNLIIFLVLLWTMHHYRAEIIIKTKYRKTKVVNYRLDNDNSKILSTCTFLYCDEYRTDYDGQIDTTRHKRSLGIQYKHESKEDIASFISKPVARPEYRAIYLLGSNCKVAPFIKGAAPTVKVYLAPFINGATCSIYKGSSSNLKFH